MFAEQIRQAVVTTRGKALDETAKLLWRGHAKGLISDDEAQELAEAINARQAAHRLAQSQPAKRRSIFLRRRPQRPSNRTESIARRRRVASSGALPGPTAEKFTQAEQAVLAIIVGQVRSTKTGDCRLCYDAIAAMAGCSRSTVKNAIRAARHIGLIQVRERRVPGAKNLPNIIEIIDRAVIAWIRRGPQRPISGDRGQTAPPHEYKHYKKRPPASEAVSARANIDRVKYRKSNST